MRLCLRVGVSVRGLWVVVVDLFACLPDLLDDCKGRVTLDNSFDRRVRVIRDDNEPVALREDGLVCPRV